MDLIEAIKNRKSIRKFTDESIKKEDLEEIIEVARRAPSSVNGQQISLVYTTDKKYNRKNCTFKWRSSTNKRLFMLYNPNRRLL